MLLRYPARYQAILGANKIGNEQAGKMDEFIVKGEPYMGSDGSEKYEIGAHAFGFTSGRQWGQV